MILDSLDMFIILEFLREKETTTWKIAKKFKWEDSPSQGFEKKLQAKTFHSAKCNLVEYRIKKMIKEGIITKEYNGEKLYVLDTDKVKLQKQKKPKVILLPNQYKECLLIKDKENKWMVFQI